MNIVLLEDDAHVAQLEQLWIETEGYQCTVFSDGKSFIARAPDLTIDLLMLDWMLPDITGDEVLSWVRNTMGWDVPIIFVTQKDREEDIVAMLEKGADDYMTKPVSPKQLLARIKALTRRASKSARPELQDYAPFKLDLNTHTLLRKDQVIPLTQKEFDLAVYLLSNSGKIITRSDLLEAVWDSNASLNTRTVDIHISRLRKKLGLNGESGWRLTGIYNHGYRMERTYNDAVESDAQLSN